MKKILGFLILTIISSNLFSQIFYDNRFNKIETRLDASYYKKIDSTQNEIIEKTYYINDSIYEIIHYSKTKEKNGKDYLYYSSGQLKYDIDYRNNKINGYLLGYFENGNKRRVDYYRNDTLIRGQFYTENGLDTIYFIFQRNATYRGKNVDYFRKFVSRKVKYPHEAILRGVEGRVIIQFGVNSKGEIVDIKILKSPDDLLSQSAIKAIKKSHRWEPAIHEGKKVKQIFVIPIDYSL